MAKAHGPCRTTYTDGTPCEAAAADGITGFCKSCRFWWNATDADPGTRPRSMAFVGRLKGLCGVLTDDGPCRKPTHSRGMCRAHTARWDAHGDPLGGAAERFGQRVTITEAEYAALGPDAPYAGSGRKPMKLDGSVFGPLTVLRRLPRTRGPGTRWVCRHENGSLMIVRTDSLRRTAAAG